MLDPLSTDHSIRAFLLNAGAFRFRSMAKSNKKLTDAERHKRFVEMAREVEASENPKDFDKAFKNITKGTDKA